MKQHFSLSKPRIILLWAGLALFILAMTVFVATDALARPAADPDNLLISADEDEAILYEELAEINAVTGVPVALYQVNYPVRPSSPEAMAEQYLRENAPYLGLDFPDLSNLQHKATREDLSGATVRYRQFVGDIPVYKGEIVVHINNNNNKVSLVTANYRPSLAVDTVPAITGEEARQLAHDHLDAQPPFSYDRTALTIYDANNVTRLAYQVRVDGGQVGGNWEVLIDAHTGELFKVMNDVYYNVVYEVNSQQGNVLEGVRVDGDGNVFDPDPLTTAMAIYGDPGFVDGGDANTPQLIGEQMNVVLPDIQFDGGLYTLIGPYAEIVDFEGPFNGLFSQPSSSFNYNRFDDAFEAANTYYHLDASMSYLSETLGIPIFVYQYPAENRVRFDPHALNGADNSYYSAGRLAFGEGGVDDAEDSDVIHHELGHGLHDWYTSGGLSQVNGLSEGTGDYWAQSYNWANETWAPNDPQHHWVFRWDGHNPFWPGRVTNYPGIWPIDLTGQIHTDGQIWSTCNMKVYDAIGKTKLDTAFWVGLGNTNSTTDQSQAANAVYQAAIDLGYSQADLIDMNTIYASCGYIMPSLPVPDFSLENQSGDLEVCKPNPAVYSIAVNTQFGFNEVVTLSLTGEPAGTSVDFSPNGTNAPYTSTLTISNTAAAATGSYAMEVSGVSISGTHTTTVNLTINDVPAAIVLTSPSDGAVDQSTTPTLQWQSDPFADTYNLGVATDAGFTNVVISETGLTGTSYMVTTPLDAGTTYYWRVQGVGTCGAGAQSAVFSFTTLDTLYVYMPVVLKAD